MTERLKPGDLKVGDVVRLRSGGPLMTVMSVGSETCIDVEVMWWDGAFYRTEALRLAMLERSEPEAGLAQMLSGCR